MHPVMNERHDERPNRTARGMPRGHGALDDPNKNISEHNPSDAWRIGQAELTFQYGTVAPWRFTMDFLMRHVLTTAAPCLLPGCSERVNQVWSWLYASARGYGDTKGTRLP